MDREAVLHKTGPTVIDRAATARIQCGAAREDLLEAHDSAVVSGKETTSQD